MTTAVETPKRRVPLFLEDLNQHNNELGFSKVRVNTDESLRRDYVAMEFRANSQPPTHPNYKGTWPKYGLKTLSVHPTYHAVVREALERANIQVTGAKPKPVAAENAAPRRRAKRTSKVTRRR